MYTQLLSHHAVPTERKISSLGRARVPGQSGFSLMEILVALTIVSLVMGGAIAVGVGAFAVARRRASALCRRASDTPSSGSPPR